MPGGVGASSARACKAVGFHIGSTQEKFRATTVELGLEKAETGPLHRPAQRCQHRPAGNLIASGGVQRRGRWRSEASVRRYEKRGTIQRVASLSSAHHRRKFLCASAELPGVALRLFGVMLT